VQDAIDRRYCTISIDLAPTRDRDRPAEIFISSVCSVTRDMTKISAGPDSIHTFRTSN
jgi:hypothetical protein